jgi:hypothetical protein
MPIAMPGRNLPKNAAAADVTAWEYGCNPEA